MKETEANSERHRIFLRHFPSSFTSFKFYHGHTENFISRDIYMSKTTHTHTTHIYLYVYKFVLRKIYI